MPSPFAVFADACRKHMPRVGLVFGSGLGPVADTWPVLAAVHYAHVPGLPAAAVAGHRGKLCLHEHKGHPLLAFHGRFHLYEGHSLEVIGRPVHLAHQLGVRTVILTNAAGGIGPEQRPGSLMAIRDHIAAIKPFWWREPEGQSPYSARLLDVLAEAAAEVGIDLPRGIYACLTGPSYETPAEIRALRTLRTDAVGMSTAHEATTAAGLGMEVAALSVIANRAAGLSEHPLSHAEVLMSVGAAAENVQRLIQSAMRQLF